MASKLTESEFRALHGHPGTDMTVSMSDTSAASATAIAAGVVHCVISTSAFHYELAASPTATTSSRYWPAKTPLYLTLNSALKIAVIKASGEDNATVWITPLTGYRT